MENNERINKGFERILKLITILGQVDSFLSNRAKIILKKLASLTDDEERQEEY